MTAVPGVGARMYRVTLGPGDRIALQWDFTGLLVPGFGGAAVELEDDGGDGGDGGELLFADPSADGRQWKLVEGSGSGSGSSSSTRHLANPSSTDATVTMLLQLTSSDMIPKPKPKPKPKSSGPSFPTVAENGGGAQSGSKNGRTKRAAAANVPEVAMSPKIMFNFGCPCCAEAFAMDGFGYGDSATPTAAGDILLGTLANL